MIQVPFFDTHDLCLILVVASCLSAIYVASTAVYRLWLHPLAKLPGPFLGRVSAALNWYHAVKGDRHAWLAREHARYGPTVRFAPTSVSFNTITAIDSIYKSRKANVTKGDWYQYVRESSGGFESTFTAREKARHGTKRRLLSQAFSERALKDYEPRIVSLIRTWVNCIEDEVEKGTSSINIGKWGDYLVFDILGNLCFGKAFGVMTSAKDRPTVSLVSEATEGWYRFGYHPLTHALRFLLFKTRFGPLVGGKFFRNNGRFRSFCLQALQERRKAEASKSDIADEKTNDIFHHLLHGRDPETGIGYSTGDLACESVLLVVAGSQSTSGALAATVFYLAHNPDILAKVKAEVRGAFQSEDEIRYEMGGKLSALPYLRACIDESMRLTPPTPGHLPREIAGKEGLDIDGYWYPPGTSVGASAYAVHRNEAYFSDPYRFNPDRWLEDAKSQEGHENVASAFYAFSAGQTGCIGKQLAYMELSLAVAMLLRRFDLRLAPGQSEDVEYQVQDCFIGRGDGPYLQLVRASTP